VQTKPQGNRVSQKGKPKKLKAKISTEARAYKIFICLLYKKSLTIKQLTQLTGSSQTTICRWLSTFHTKPENLVYIDHWERSATVGPYTAYWSWGYMKEDAVRPPPLTNKEKNARFKRTLRTRQLTNGVIRHVSNI